MEPKTEAGRAWLAESRGIEKRMRERIIKIEREILESLEISDSEFEARKLFKSLKHPPKKE